MSRYRSWLGTRFLQGYNGWKVLSQDHCQKSCREHYVVFLGFLNFFVHVGFAYMQITVLLLNKK